MKSKQLSDFEEIISETRIELIETIVLKDNGTPIDVLASKHFQILPVPVSVVRRFRAVDQTKRIMDMIRSLLEGTQGEDAQTRKRMLIIGYGTTEKTRDVLLVTKDTETGEYWMNRVPADQFTLFEHAISLDDRILAGVIMKCSDEDSEFSEVIQETIALWRL